MKSLVAVLILTVAAVAPTARNANPRVPAGRPRQQIPSTVVGRWVREGSGHQDRWPDTLVVRPDRILWEEYRIESAACRVPPAGSSVGFRLRYIYATASWRTEDEKGVATRETQFRAEREVLLRAQADTLVVCLGEMRPLETPAGVIPNTSPDTLRYVRVTSAGPN